jgi:hypothetical protein
MLVAEVQTLFRQYIDEPDQSFVTDAMVATMLTAAYQEFQWTVMQTDDSIYTTIVDLTLSSQATYDLAAPASTVRVFGADANLTNPRLMKLDALYRTSDTVVLTPLEPVATPQSLSQMSGAYMLDGTILRFSERRSGTLTMKYFPQYVAAGAAPAISNYIDWTVGGTGTFIDNLSMFHDVIALLASKQYFILDNAINEMLMAQLQLRTGDLTKYLTARAYDGSQYVSQVFGG